MRTRHLCTGGGDLFGNMAAGAVSDGCIGGASGWPAPFSVHEVSLFPEVRTSHPGILSCLHSTAGTPFSLCY